MCIYPLFELLLCPTKDFHGPIKNERPQNDKHINTQKSDLAKRSITRLSHTSWQNVPGTRLHPRDSEINKTKPGICSQMSEDDRKSLEK